MFFREAEATRNALHGVQWPIGNGKKLIIEYSTPEDMEVARNPPAPAPIVEAKIPDKENAVILILCLFCTALFIYYTTYVRRFIRTKGIIAMIIQIKFYVHFCEGNHGRNN